MKKEQMERLLNDAAKKYGDNKKVAKRADTQFKAGAMWLWDLLMSEHDVSYYEGILRNDVMARLDKVEEWQESLITETAKMMVERDGMERDILDEGRLLLKYDRNMQPYKESNPLYVHLKELQRSIGMQREHLGLSFKVNPMRMKESPKKNDAKDEPIGEFIDGING